MDIPEGGEIGWLMIGGFLYMMHLLMQVLGFLLNLYVYKRVLQAVRKQEGKEADMLIGGSSRKDFIRDLLLWIALGFLFTFIPVLGASSFQATLWPGLLFFAPLNLTFWYHDAGFRNYQLRPLQKIIPQLLLFLGLTFGYQALGFVRVMDGKALAQLYYLFYPVLFGCLIWFLVKQNRRDFVEIDPAG